MIRIVLGAYAVMAIVGAVYVHDASHSPVSKTPVPVTTTTTPTIEPGLPDQVVCVTTGALCSYV